jgi:ABC-type transport system involved in multi-copper enzyme maturation permease subunit
MLWHKAWRESRTRFAITAVVLAGFCAFAVLFHNDIRTNGSLPEGLRSPIFSERIYILMYSGTAKGAFALLIMFLGLGGLLREQRHRTAIFTLALPISRLRLVITQIAVGLAELAILSLLPAVLIPSLSIFVHQSYPLAEALHFSMLWFVCGSVIFAAAFFLAVVFAGEYTAPVVCYVALMLQALILLPLRLNLLWTMGEFGRMHWDAQHTSLITGPLPWARLLIIMLIALGTLASAARITQRQDF